MEKVSGKYTFDNFISAYLLSFVLLHLGTHSSLYICLTIGILFIKHSAEFAKILA